MSTKKATKAKDKKPKKGKSAPIAKKAKPSSTGSSKTSLKKSATKKVVKEKPSPKNSAKPTKVPTKKKGMAEKKSTRKVEAKLIPKKQKPTKPAKVVKPVAKKEKNKIDAKKNKSAGVEGKSTKTKKDKVVEGVELNKKKLAGTATKSKRGKKKKGDDDDEPAIDVDDVLLAEILETVKPKKKNTKEVKQIRTFVNPMASLTVAKVVKEGKKAISAAKEPKGKYVLEFVIGTSSAILYEFLTTPSGLSEWFSDDVNIHDGVFTFVWEGSEQKALLLDFKDEKFIRFQWVDKPEGTYFEFKIEVDELTGDVSLMVTDFADEGSDLETSKRLWESQIHTLMHVIGSY